MKKGIILNESRKPSSYFSKKKGITPVIAIILLLLITISMVGFAYVWFNKTLTTVTSKAENQTLTQVNAAAKTVRIDNVGSNTFAFRNTGTGIIKTSELAVIVDSNPVQCDWGSATEIAPGDVIQCTTIVTCNTAVKITAPGGQDIVECSANAQSGGGCTDSRSDDLVCGTNPCGTSANDNCGNSRTCVYCPVGQNCVSGTCQQQAQSCGSNVLCGAICCTSGQICSSGVCTNSPAISFSAPSTVSSNTATPTLQFTSSGISSDRINITVLDGNNNVVYTTSISGTSTEYTLPSLISGTYTVVYQIVNQDGTSLSPSSIQQSTLTINPVTNGAPTALSSCTIACNDVDGCSCPSVNPACVTTGNINNGQTCGGQTTSGGSGTQTLTSCFVTCAGTSCTCPTGCTVTSSVTNGQTCGGYSNPNSGGGTGNPGSKTTLTSCSLACADPDGCTCAATNCNVPANTSINQNQDCGGSTQTGGGSGDTIKTDLNSCTQSCADPDGCVCKLTTCNTAANTQISDGQNCGGATQTCSTEQTFCTNSNTCVNLQTDSNNCGSCGHVCSSSQSCNSGTCVSSSGLVAKYSFEDSVQDSVGNNNGVLLGGAVYGTGVKGKAIVLDGIDDKIEIPYSSDIDMTTNDFTIELFARSDASAQSSVLLSKKAWFESNGAGYFIAYASNPVNVYTGVYDTKRHIINTGLTATFDWKQIVLAKQGSEIKTYVDGSLLSAGEANTDATGSLTNTDKLIIGYQSNKAYFKGSIDEIRIYRRALTQAEILNDCKTDGGCKPTISILAPTDASTITTNSLTASFSATNVDSTKKINITLDTQVTIQLVSTSTSQSFSSLSNGAHTLKFQIVNTDGTAVASCATCTVTRAFSVNVAAIPTIAITSPATNNTAITTNSLAMQFSATNAAGKKINISLDNVFVIQKIDTDTSYTLSSLTNSGHTVKLEIVNTDGTSLSPALTAARTFSVNTCTAGQSLCSGTCYNLQTDNNHCGSSCANAVACSSGQICISGTCAIKALTNYYPFTTNGNDAIGANNLVLPSDATIVSDGKYGLAISLTTNISTNLIPSAQTASSISLWFKFSAVTSASWFDNNFVVGTSDVGYGTAGSPDTQKSFVIAFINGYLYTVEQNSGGLIAFANTTVSMNVNQWHHLVLTFSKINNNQYNTEFKKYYDGVLVGTTYLTPQNTKLYLGGRNTNGIKLDEVKYYNYALSQSEISILYSGEAGLCTDHLDNDNNGKCDYDGLNCPSGMTGDTACPVSVTNIAVSNSAPTVNTAITVSCTVNVGGLQSIGAKIVGQTSNCPFVSWSSNVAQFTCTPTTTGSNTVQCFVDTTKAASQTSGQTTSTIITVGAACVPETDTQFCSRLSKTCGSVTANDNCGTSRTVTSCGTCTNTQLCSNNVCVQPTVTITSPTAGQTITNDNLLHFTVSNFVSGLVMKWYDNNLLCDGCSSPLQFDAVASGDIGLATLEPGSHTLKLDLIRNSDSNIISTSTVQTTVCAGSGGVCTCSDTRTNAQVCGTKCSGTQNDNCGTSRTCTISSCSSSQVCNSGTCCTPTTCAAQGKNCGSISNGCGGTLSCGTCTSPMTCGGGGTANVCGPTGYGNTWIAKSMTSSWRFVAMSSNGQYQTIVSDAGQIYVSTNSGSTWTLKVSSVTFDSLLMTADGQKQIASGGGKKYSSTDGGNTWVTTNGDPILGMSSNGLYLFRSGYYTDPDTGDTYPTYFSSSDGGNTWVQSSFANVNNLLYLRGTIAMSSDGTYQTAVGAGITVNGVIYVSSDHGNSWIQKPQNFDLNRIAMSSDGTYQIAGQVNGGGKIFISIDHGVTWTSKNLNAENLAVSSDGTYMLAVSGGTVYTSLDHGSTWTSKNIGGNNLESIATSSNGRYETTAGYNGYVYVSG